MSDKREFTQEQARAMYDMLMEIIENLDDRSPLSIPPILRINKILQGILVNWITDADSALVEQDTQS